MPHGTPSEMSSEDGTSTPEGGEEPGTSCEKDGGSSSRDVTLTRVNLTSLVESAVERALAYQRISPPSSTAGGE